jgi:hypothetical protein
VSLATNRKVRDPAVIGLPLMTPSELNVNPAGSVPNNDHVYGAVPPPTLNRWE